MQLFNDSSTAGPWPGPSHVLTTAGQNRAMEVDDHGNHLVEYRGHRYSLELRQHGEVWSGHYRLLDASPQQALQAAEAGRHQWTSMDPSWRTSIEAQRNATEAAHAAIDALCQ